MKNILGVSVGLISIISFNGFAAGHDPTAIHDRGKQKIIGELTVTGKLSAGDLSTTRDLSARHITSNGTLRTTGALVSTTGTFSRTVEAAGFESTGNITASGDLSAKGAALGTCCPMGAICVRGGDASAGRIKAIQAATGIGLADAKDLTLAGRSGNFDCGVTHISAYDGPCTPAVSVFNSVTYEAICPSDAALYVTRETVALRRPLRLPTVHYGLTIQFEHPNGSSCDDADVAQFKQDVESWLASVNPDAPIPIAIDGCNSFSFISSFSNENIPGTIPQPPGESVTHVIQDYYLRNGDGSHTYMCASHESGLIALTNDPRGPALIECQGHGASGLYRRYAPSMTIEF